MLACAVRAPRYMTALRLAEVDISTIRVESAETVSESVIAHRPALKRLDDITKISQVCHVG